jgi:beta-mannosidase
MKSIHDLSQLQWTLSSYRPYEWLAGQCLKMAAFRPEIEKIPANVPGSVQEALFVAGLIPDWNVAFNSRQCEWIEHRHWVFEARIPQEWLEGRTIVRLKCEGLDFAGWICLNWKELSKFNNAHIPHTVDLKPHLAAASNYLQIVFDLPPRWLGVPYYSKQITQWKPRFNYSWDWTERIVQIGIWDAVNLETGDGRGSIEQIKLDASADPHSCKGRLRITGSIIADPSNTLKVSLFDKEHTIRSCSILVK